MTKITILIHCKDISGIIASVTNFIQRNHGNIVYLDQHVDRQNGIFFMRCESEFSKAAFDSGIFKSDFKHHIAQQYQMQWQLHTDAYRPKMAIFVSKYDHCLYDLLGRYNSGELHVEIPFIISNHPHLQPIAEAFKIPFYHIPCTQETSAEATIKQLELLKEHQVDFIVLARYMQIISNTLIQRYQNKIINIHHSFLPAFVGAKPYHSAYKRGVKIIGATSHYVTAELDAGPIIEQDVTRVTHTHAIEDMVAKGRDLEKIVLARGIKLHVDRKTMVYNNKTIIFS